MSLNLFEIEEQYQHILQLLEAAEGEITPEIEEQLVINEENFEAKAGNYRSMIMKWKADIAAAKEEEARIKAFKTNRTNAIERLSANLDMAMTHRGMTKLDMGVKGKISYRKSTAVLVDEDKLPKKWFVKKVTTSPDKTALKEALAAGTKVRGAALETRQNIQIK